MLAKKRSMTELLLNRYQNRSLTGVDFRDFVDEVFGLLPKGTDKQALRDSIRNLVGQKLTGQLLDETCWRLAGNIKRLKQTRAVPPWSVQRYPEWVPAQIIKVRLQRGGKRGLEFGHEITFRILAGTSCPNLIVQWWSRNKFRYLAHNRDEQGNGFGFVRVFRDKPSPYEYHYPNEFVTLRCLLLIEPECCDVEGPNFKEISHSSGTSAWNRVQQKYRARIEAPYLCIKKLSRDMLCHQCPFGLDVCRAATHSKTYQLRPCSQCNDAKAVHDPADKLNSVCVDCVECNIVHPKNEED